MLGQEIVLKIYNLHKFFVCLFFQQTVKFFTIQITIILIQQVTNTEPLLYTPLFMVCMWEIQIGSKQGLSPRVNKRGPIMLIRVSHSCSVI